MTYDDFAFEHPCAGFCWACGRDMSDQPNWWHAPWLIERAHITNKPRKLDVRAIVLLCSGCHKVSHGERFRQWVLPRLTLANMLHLKRVFDGDNFDMVFLQRCAVQRLPDPAPLPQRYLDDYLRYHARDELSQRSALIRLGVLPVPEQELDESDYDYLERIAAQRRNL